MKKSVLWVAALLFLAASVYFFNVATYNWFSADFQNQYSRAYATRGNLFFVAALACCGAFIGVTVVIWRRGKASRLGAPLSTNGPGKPTDHRARQ